MGKIVIGEGFSPEGEEVEVKEDQSTETEEVKESEEQSEEGSAETEEKAEEPQKINIGDKEFTGIIEKGGKVQEWETKMPGFNLDTLMPDYTKKSQKLAQYEKHPAPKAEEVDLSDVDADELDKFDRIAKHRGFIKQSDIVQDSVEVQKNTFIASHPEYKQGIPANDAKWEQLMEQFALYNWQAFPHKVEDMLEKAHSEVSKTWNEDAKNQKTKESVTTKQAIVDAVAKGGSGSQKTAAPKDNSALADRYRALGWAEEDIKEILN